jgi:hypothetical protein
LIPPSSFTAAELEHLTDLQGCYDLAICPRGTRASVTPVR